MCLLNMHFANAHHFLTLLSMLGPLLMQAPGKLQSVHVSSVCDINTGNYQKPNVKPTKRKKPLNLPPHLKRGLLTERQQNLVDTIHTLPNVASGNISDSFFKVNTDVQSGSKICKNQCFYCEQTGGRLGAAFVSSPNDLKS